MLETHVFSLAAIGQELENFTPEDLQAVAATLPEPDQSQSYVECVGVLSEGGQRLFCLRAVYKDKLARLEERRASHPDDTSLMLEESVLEEQTARLTNLLAKEYARMGCSLEEEGDFVCIGHGFIVYQGADDEADDEEEEDDGYFLSTRDHLGSCGLPN